MATSFVTPNMNLTVPVPGQESGPQWANDLNNSLAVIDAHNHAPGSGVQINPGGININADLSFNSNNATSVRTVRFSAQSSAITASTPDLGCLYEAGVDLYYNDGAGNQIRITQGGSVTGSTGTITGLPSGTASAAYSAGSGTFVFQQATSVAANLDVASIAIRYPGSYPTPSGNYIQLQAPSSLSSGYSITLPALPASTLPVSLSTAGVLSTAQITTAQIANQAVGTTQLTDQNVTQGKLALKATGTTVGAGGFAISSSCGLDTHNGGTNTQVTNFNLTITTTGRPVYIGMVDDGSLNAAGSTISVGSGAVNAGLQINRNNVQITNYFLQDDTQHPPGSFGYFDLVAAGTYTYSININTPVADTVIRYTKMVVYEI